MDDPFDLPPDVLRRIPLFAEISKVLSWSGGPVNWDLARQVAVSIAAGEAPTRAPDGADHEEVAALVRVAELWLGEATTLPPPSHLVAARAATPVDWAEHASGAFGELVEPIAAKVTRALGDDGEHDPLSLAFGQMAPMLMGIQAGMILGNLAREVTGTHDVELPATEDAIVLVLPTIDAIATEYGLDRAQVRQWVALRAAARRMAFEGFPWLRARFFSLYHNYVSSLDVDIARGIERLKELDLTDPSRLQEVLGDEGLLSTNPSPQTAAAASSVTRCLSVVEGYAGAAVERAALRAGDTARVAEAFSRRTASAGPGARMLGRFVGLDGEPAERRAARAFVDAVIARRGWAGLNRAWEEPDAFPTSEEIGDPDGWLRRIDA